MKMTSNQLKAIRKNIGRSQERLATLLGIPVSRVQEMERDSALTK